ncbi:MAG: sulfatase-like hydrolase/transferase [Clostridia bacterium]|nr:sulfatase-like hydrolase/transferase [Clostridia bacterium]
MKFFGKLKKRKDDLPKAETKRKEKPKKERKPIEEMTGFERFFYKYLHNGTAMCLLLAFSLNLIIETLARQTAFGGILYLAESPLVFLYNMLIIFATLAVALLFKRRAFMYFLISALWLALGITNGIILSNRMTPFTTKDLTVLEDGLSIVTNYMSTFEIVLMIIGAVLLLAIVVLTFIFAPKKKDPIRYKRVIAGVLIVMMATYGATQLAIKVGVVHTFFGNLAYAYRDYGVPYCFINTWLNTGINMPNDYSKERMLSIFEPGELSEDGTADITFEDDGKKHPNIIFLQLESFIDPQLVTTIKYSEDPIPNYRNLMKNYSSGYLTVPSVGAGTANTEFEVMSGMSVKFFGPGEYPYKSILREKTCESAAYDLKSIGYSTHAIHNHRGVFYNRNEVFANLGYDDFTSVEYMNGTVKTPKNWAKDAVLTGVIMDALDSTENEDYIYTVSVQGHGKYPTEEILENPAIKVTSAPTEALKWQYEYYANQVYEMDKFVKDLTDELQHYPEKVVLVMYGDHLPALEMTEEEMGNKNLFQTEYVIWSNFKMDKEDKDLYTYEITADVLNRIGIHNGVMTKFHQNHGDSITYKADLKALEYDMLYGKQFIFGGKSPFERVKMRMGINPISINEVVQIGKKFYLKGENFTEYSKISLDGKILKTIFLGPNILGLLEEVEPEDVTRMKVSQVEKNKEILSTTE